MIKIRLINQCHRFLSAGHLVEMCEASEVNAVIDFSRVPQLDGVTDLLQEHNMKAHAIGHMTERSNDFYIQVV